MNVKKAKDFTLLPALPENCPICNFAHSEDHPHNLTVFYGIWLQQNEGREATWHTAMEHCTEEMKKAWIAGLKEQGVEI